MSGWWIYFPKEELIKIILREAYSKSDIDKIVVEIERKIPNPADYVRMVEQMLSERDERTLYNREPTPAIGEAELQIIRRNISSELRQEIHEEISRSEVDFGNKLKEIVDRIQKLEERIDNQPGTAPVISSPVDSAPIQNAINQIQTTQQQILVRLGQVETGLNAPQPAVVPVGVTGGISQDQFESQNRTIEKLRAEVVAQSQNYATVKSAFDTQARENAALKQTISGQERRLLDLEKENARQNGEISELKKQLDSLREILNRLTEGIAPKVTGSPVKSVPQTRSIATSSETWIKSFALSKSAHPKAFFHGDGATVKTKLAQSIRDMDGLITYLPQSGIVEPARTSFMKNLRWCMEALEKLYEKFDFDGCDSEEISEEITGKFFKIIGENLLDNVMTAVYRGGKDADGYQEFLQNVNNYLSKHGIYTEDIVPGTMIEGDMLSNIEPPISKQTAVSADDGKVDEVELLPYFMFYEDDDGNLDTVRKRGRVVRLKYGV